MARISNFLIVYISGPTKIEVNKLKSKFWIEYQFQYIQIPFTMRSKKIDMWKIEFWVRTNEEKLN